MLENLKVYEKIRSVPKEAQKEIGAGRLKGMTDINPMWRIKTLTEQFGMCGIGWYYDLVDKHIEEGANSEKVSIVDIKLYVKVDGEWSKPIYGTGGSKLVNKESAGLYTSDECYKMALTDAISVACKSLGMGADIYYAKDRTKYDLDQKQETSKKEELKITNIPLLSKQQSEIITKNKDTEIVKGALEYYKKTIEQLNIAEASTIIRKLLTKKEEKENE
jgi:hypothetical protein